MRFYLVNIGRASSDTRVLNCSACGDDQFSELGKNMDGHHEYGCENCDTVSVCMVERDTVDD